MTKEERKKAIEVLDDMKVKIDIPKAAKTQNDRNWALDVAIQALSQEPCNDAVSRQAVLDKIYNVDGMEEFENSNIFAKHYADIVKALPPVTPKSETVTEFADRCRECGKMRKGHWIYDETIENWQCSKCNETPKTMGYVGTADFMAEHFKFCNHCGARMVEPQESEKWVNFAEDLIPVMDEAESEDKE
jgi:hypothetical protein